MVNVNYSKSSNEVYDVFEVSFDGFGVYFKPYFLKYPRSSEMSCEELKEQLEVL